MIKLSYQMAFLLVTICLFTSCLPMYQSQKNKDVKYFTSVLLNSQLSQSQAIHLDQKSREKEKELQERIELFCSNFFTKEELREIAIFYSSNKVEVLTKELRKNPSNAKIREEFLREAETKISQATLKKISSPEFYKEIKVIVSQFIEEECLKE